MSASFYYFNITDIMRWYFITSISSHNVSGIILCSLASISSSAERLVRLPSRNFSLWPGIHFSEYLLWIKIEMRWRFNHWFRLDANHPRLPLITRKERKIIEYLFKHVPVTKYIIYVREQSAAKNVGRVLWSSIELLWFDITMTNDFHQTHPKVRRFFTWFSTNNFMTR